MKTCTLVIKDEVNCFFSGIDAQTKRKIKEHFTYYVPGYRHMPKYKLGRWDGRISLFNNGWTFNNLIDEEIIGILDSEGYEIDMDDQREEDVFVPEPIDEESFAFTKWDGTEIKLRDYQVAAVNTALDNRCGLLRLATGAGKSYVCAAIAKQFSPGGRIIVIVPTIDLVTQTAESFRDLGVEDVGEFSGNKKDATNVVISTWQSLRNYPEMMEGVICAIVDECHNAKAKEIQEIMSVAGRDVPYRYGFTGTVPDDDLARNQIIAITGPLIFTKDAWELQESGVLSECHIDVMQSKEDPRLDFADYHAEHKFLTTDLNRLEWIAKTTEAIAQSGNTLVLVKNIATGKAIAEYIGDSAVFLSGGTKSEKRKEHYKSINELDGKILICTKGIASTGIDIPRIFNLVLVESGKSFVETIQSIGRGLRRADDKDYVQIFDICASTKYSKKHLTQRKKYYKEAKYPFTVRKVDYR